MGPPELIIIGIIALVVVFGAKKVPEMARSIGRAQGEFKKGLKEGAVPEDDEATPEQKPGNTSSES